MLASELENQIGAARPKAFNKDLVSQLLILTAIILIMSWLMFTGINLSKKHEIIPSVLTDNDGIETITSVTQAERAGDFHYSPNGFSRGYTRSVHWLKFTITPPTPDNSNKRELYLEIQPPCLDEIDIYWPTSKDKEAYTIYHTGDLTPSNKRELTYRTFLNKISFEDDQPKTGYIRIKTTSSSIMFLRAWEPNKFWEIVQIDYLWIGIISGLLLASIFSNLWIGLWRTQKLHRAYILYIANTFATLIFASGLHNVLWPNASPDFGNHGISVTTILMTTFGVYFYRQALFLKTGPKFIYLVSHLTLWLSILALPSPFLDLYPETIKLLFPFLLFALFCHIFRIIQLHRQKVPGMIPLLTAHIFSLSGNLTTALTLLGILSGQVWLVYGYQAATLGTLAALQWTMMQRLRLIEKNQAHARITIERAQAKAEQACNEREHQRRFLAMLTHELKTPLSVLRMYMGSASASANMRIHAINAVGAINDLVERCGFVSSIDEQRIRCQCDKFSIINITYDLIEQLQAKERIECTVSVNNISTTRSDPLLVRIIISNLIDNALKYAPKNHKISIQIRPQTRHRINGTQFIISNPSGPAGLPNPNQIFDKYYRAPSARTQTGSGLGLYIVQELCSLINSKINYTPTETEARFELWIPQNSCL